MTEERYVLDASALLALLGREPGADAVAMVLSTATISTVNWSEVVQKALGRGVDVDGLDEDLASLGLQIVDFTVEHAALAARLWQAGARHLALGDRACLATAAASADPVLTADRAWSSVDVDTEVMLIR